MIPGLNGHKGIWVLSGGLCQPGPRGLVRRSRTPPRSGSARRGATPQHADGEHPVLGMTTEVGSSGGMRGEPLARRRRQDYQEFALACGFAASDVVGPLLRQKPRADADTRGSESCGRRRDREVGARVQGPCPQDERCAAGKPPLAGRRSPKASGSGRWMDLCRALRG